MIAGVCRGLADRFGIPIAVTRLLAILSVFAGGWGFILYGALWIAMPLTPLPTFVAPPVAGPLVTPPPHNAG
jgi:phage shock protein PspC (stress-responsive transcriptional regulator)